MRINKKHITLALAIIFFILAVMMMSGCSPVKKVLKDPMATEQVAMEYIKRNPPKNDTAYLPGKVITRDTTIYDTIPLPYPVKDKFTERHYKETLVRDTVKIIDRSFAEGLAKRVDALEKKVSEITAEKNEWKKEAWIHRGIWIAIILIFIGRMVSKIIWPFIKLRFKI